MIDVDEIKRIKEEDEKMQSKIILRQDGAVIWIKNVKLKHDLKYDLKLKCMMKFYRNEGAWKPVTQQYEFFKGYTINDIVCDEIKFLGMIKKVMQLNPNCSSLSTFISRLGEALVYENYEEQGIETECRVHSNGWGGKRKEVLNKPISFYSKNTLKLFRDCKISLSCSLEELFIKDYNFMTKLCNVLVNLNISNEDKKEFLESLSYQNVRESFSELINVYRYDMGSLINYVMNYLKPFENLGLRSNYRNEDAFSLLKDYYRMANMIGREVKKYPKYLKSMHDIITSNYNAYKKEYDEKLFEKTINCSLEFRDKDFAVIVPRTTKEIISEGTDLNHCVGSYVDNIIEGKTYIMFMRNALAPDSSLITLELKGGEKITQAKGSYNRALNEAEMKFLNKYCKEKELILEI